MTKIFEMEQGVAMKKTLQDKLRNSSILKRWFFSYLLVFAVPLLLCFLLYRQAYHTIREESEELYSSALEQVRIDMDAYLKEVQQVQEQLLLSNTTQTATRIGAAVRPADQLTTVDVRDELQHVMVSHGNLAYVALILNQSDSVVTRTGYMSLPIFHRLSFGAGDFSLNELRDYMKQPHMLWDMLLQSDTNGRQYLLFTRTTIDNNFGKPTGTVVVAVSQALLRQRLQQFSWDERLNFYIVSPDSQLICHTGGNGTLEIPFGELNPSDTLRTVENDGQTCGMLVRSSTVSGWRYVLLVEDSLLRQSARRIQLYTYLGLLICMLIGVALSNQLARRNYHPLRLIMGRLSARDDAAPPAKGNEFAQLDSYIQDFFEKRSNDQHDLWNSRRELRKYHLYTLLERPYNDAQCAPDGMPLIFPADAYLVVLFMPPSEDRTMGGDLMRFAVMNIFEEVVGTHFPVEMTHAGENVAAVVGLPSAGGSLPDVLEEDIRFTQQQIQEHFQLAMGAACGDPHPDISGIHYSYEEALEAASYQRAGEEADLVAYRDIRDARSNYVFPLEEERKLIDLIAAGKSAEARLVLDQVFSSNVQRGVQSASVARCLAYDIMSALVKGANLAGVNGLSVLRFVELEHCPAAGLPEKLGELVDLLCEKVQQSAQTSTPASELCGQVRAYIQANYSDPDLNISQTGLRFELTPAYLSALFKRETGTSLLGYITQVRVDAAKELLVQGRPVARIAEQCGFRESGTLIRVFKKSTGLTPGQCKAIHAEGTPPTTDS